VSEYESMWLHHGRVSLSHPVSCPMGNGRCGFFRDRRAKCEMAIKAHRVPKIKSAGNYTSTALRNSWRGEK
jgi:hypothetical protein